MSSQELLTVLTSVGMNEKQARLYLAALRLGTAPASRIATGAELNRATAYHLLEDMVREGYVAASDRFGTRHYTAIPPQQLLALLEERRTEIARVQERLQGMVGDLESLRMASTVEPTIRVFEGKTGLKDLHRRSLRSKTPIRVWDMTTTTDPDIYHFFREEFVPERVQRGIESRVIATEEGGASNPIYLREVRVCPMEPRNVDIRTFDAHTVITSYSPEEQFGIDIESPYITDALNAIFETLWVKLPASKGFANADATVAAPAKQTRKVGKKR